MSPSRPQRKTAATRNQAIPTEPRTPETSSTRPRTSTDKHSIRAAYEKLKGAVRPGCRSSFLTPGPHVSPSFFQSARSPVSTSRHQNRRGPLAENDPKPLRLFRSFSFIAALGLPAVLAESRRGVHRAHRPKGARDRLASCQKNQQPAFFTVRHQCAFQAHCLLASFNNLLSATCSPGPARILRFRHSLHDRRHNGRRQNAGQCFFAATRPCRSVPGGSMRTF